MANNEVPVDQVREYVQRLTPEARSRLLVELERLQLSGDEVKGTETLLAELRAEFRKGGHAHDRVKSPSRYFFQPLEPMLVNRAPERANPGQISRTSLAAIWEWIGQFLLPAMTREYETKMKPVIVADKTGEAERMAAAFQAKIAKCLEGTLAAADSVERTRGELAKYTSSRAAFDDLSKTLSVLQAADALARFNAALPPQIGSFDGKSLSKIRRLLETLAAKHSKATPFALTMVSKRLKVPWQLIRLATRTARSRNAADIAATPYAVTVGMVLDQLDDKRLDLSNALKNDRSPDRQGHSDRYFQHRRRAAGSYQAN